MRSVSSLRKPMRKEEWTPGEVTPSGQASSRPVKPKATSAHRGGRGRPWIASGSTQLRRQGYVGQARPGPLGRWAASVSHTRISTLLPPRTGNILRLDSQQHRPPAGPAELPRDRLDQTPDPECLIGPDRTGGGDCTTVRQAGRVRIRSSLAPVGGSVE